MQQGRQFVREIDATKQKIESRYTREFVRLYKRIGNDLINLLQKNQSINFQETFQNYQPDYIYIFRNIFNDTKKELGYGIRNKLNFNLSSQVLLKSVMVEEEEQEKVNDLFDEKYTLLLNNRTEELANNDFTNSEAKYFENLYTKSIGNYEEFIEEQRREQATLGAELLALLFITSPSKQEKARIRYLQRRTEALKQNINSLTEKRNKTVLNYFKDNLQEKIPVRSKGNAEYGTGQASSEIRETEYQSIKESNSIASSGVLVASLIRKVWWERSQFIFGANPRVNHLALSGTEANSQGNFSVSGYSVPQPRDPSLPAEESVRCRCEVEYII
jgi:hypothetical protein